jgi:glycosyltransferase involved in cell wall biosynthesis
MKKVLFSNLEVKEEGHHIFYLNILLEKIQLYLDKGFECYFLLSNPHIEKYLKTNGVNVTFAWNSEITNSWKRGLKYNYKKWRIIKKYAKSFGVDEVVILDFSEGLIVPIFFSKISFNISFILYRPFDRIFCIALKKFYFKLYFESLKKFLLFKILDLKHHKVNRVFILNDYESTAYFNRKFKIRSFFLPDPVADLSVPESSRKQLRSKYNLPERDIVILIFGAISPRKNIEILINSLILIDEISPNIIVFIVGQEQTKGYLSELKTFFDEIEFKNKVEIRLIKAFLNDNRMIEVFSLSDFVFLAYKDFYFSSGNLGLAAKFNKFSLVPNDGPMADLAVEYNLGMPINPDSIEEVKDGILYCIENQEMLENNMKSEEFCNEFSYENFVKAILT